MQTINMAYFCTLFTFDTLNICFGGQSWFITVYVRVTDLQCFQLNTGVIIFLLSTVNHFRC